MSTFSSHLFFKLLVFTISTQFSTLYAADFPEIDESKSEESKVSREYKEFIALEKKNSDAEHSQEMIASGAAAILIGLYGYYNTNPNPVVKLIYAATQTAGVLTLSGAIRDQNTKKLSLELDKLIEDSNGRPIDPLRIKYSLIKHKQTSKHAENKTLAYSSSILSGLYLYNGMRERGEDKTLRNIYIFLSINFAIGGGVGFYRVYNDSSQSESLTIDLFPLPQVAYLF
jgi:hypothetical protein